MTSLVGALHRSRSEETQQLGARTVERDRSCDRLMMAVETGAELEICFFFVIKKTWVKVHIGCCSGWLFCF